MARTTAQRPWEDLTGGLMPAVAPVGWVAILRPDKVVMHDGPVTDASALLKQAWSLVGGRVPAGKPFASGLT
jgi:3-(3-hydroxy-phenyl)propionate hydroxylase